jgi:hypothetical protein
MTPTGRKTRLGAYGAPPFAALAAHEYALLGVLIALVVAGVLTIASVVPRTDGRSDPEKK